MIETTDLSTKLPTEEAIPRRSVSRMQARQKRNGEEVSVPEGLAKEVLSYIEAAAFLQVTDRWVRDLVKRKVIPHRRLGRHVRFFRSELVQWLDRQKGVKLR